MQIINGISNYFPNTLGLISMYTHETLLHFIQNRRNIDVQFCTRISVCTFSTPGFFPFIFLLLKILSKMSAYSCPLHLSEHTNIRLKINKYSDAEKELAPFFMWLRRHSCHKLNSVGSFSSHPCVFVLLIQEVKGGHHASEVRSHDTMSVQCVFAH